VIGRTVGGIRQSRDWPRELPSRSRHSLSTMPWATELVTVP
jgi:hypothetical protein